MTAPADETAKDSTGKSLRVAVGQLTSVDDLRVNLKRIFEILRRLEADVPDFVCFPENALYMRIRDADRVHGIAKDDAVIREIADWARANKVAVHLGSVPVLRDGKTFNSSLLLREDGSIHDIYQKIHLFDVDVEGQKPVRESDVFTHGGEPSIFAVKGWKIGSTICYDLRFSELYLHYARNEVDVILIPAAFLVPTGKAHWDILTRARAIESQCYVVAAAQGGSHVGIKGETRATFGHSRIIDPWGQVLVECGDDVTGDAGPDKRILRQVLTREKIDRVRAQIPMKKHRRL